MTKDGFTINDIIQGGIDNEDNPIGIVAVSADSFLKFDEIFTNIANNYYKRDIKQNKFENESYSMLKSFIMNMDDMLNDHCVEFEIQASRNISEFPFSPKISRGNRKELANIIKEKITKFEKDVFNERGVFSLLAKTNEIKDPMYLLSGVYRDWPNDRYVYSNNNETFFIIINGEDHLKIKQKSKTETIKNSDLLLCYVDFLEKIETQFNLAYNDAYGFLNLSISDIGSGLYFTFKFKISNQKQKKEDLLSHFQNNNDVNVKLKEENDFCIAEFSNTNPYYNLSSFLIDVLGIKKVFID